MTRTNRPNHRRALFLLIGLGAVACRGSASAPSASAPLTEPSPPREGGPEAGEDRDQVREWNQIFIDALIATRPANAASPRLAAIVHTAIFDAWAGIERTHAPIHVRGPAPEGASVRAAVVSAAHTALVGLFPSE